MRLDRSKGLYKKKGYTIIEKLLKRRKLTKYDACRVMGISNPHFHRICNDYAINLTFTNMYKLAGLLGIGSLELLWCLERSKEMTDVDRMTLEDRCADSYDDVVSDL